MPAVRISVSAAFSLAQPAIVANQMRLTGVPGLKYFLELPPQI